MHWFVHCLEYCTALCNTHCNVYCTATAMQGTKHYQLNYTLHGILHYQLHYTLHCTINCSLHCTINCSLYCTLSFTPSWIMYRTLQCTLDTAHYILHTAHCTLHTTHCKLNTVQLRAHWALFWIVPLVKLGTHMLPLCGVTVRYLKEIQRVERILIILESSAYQMLPSATKLKCVWNVSEMCLWKKWFILLQKHLELVVLLSQIKCKG